MKIFKKLYQRYKDMGSLPWIVCIVLLSVIAYYTVPVIGLIQAGGDELYWVGRMSATCWPWWCFV